MIFLAIILSYAGWAVAGNLTVVYEWKCLDYLWNSSADRAAAIASGNYIPEIVFSNDVDVFEDKVWVTTPILMGGVPATLSTVSNETSYCGRLLKPFPDWSWHTRTDCKGITNVWRVAIDGCNRLWVLDSGFIGSKRVCPASLIVFDAETNKLLNRYDLPDEVVHSPTANRSLVTPVVETYGLNCKDTWVYMADELGYALLVWHNNVTWRLDDDVYAPSPDALIFTIDGESFKLKRGVHGLAVSPARNLGVRGELFFKPMSSLNLFSTRLNDLHSSRTRSVSYWKSDYQLPSQSSALAFSRRGVLFFGLISEMSLACWNMRRPFNANNVFTVAQDKKYLQIASGVKVKRMVGGDIRSEYVWVSTNRFQKTMTGSRNWNETNFSILKKSVKDLIGHTKCY